MPSGPKKRKAAKKKKENQHNNHLGDDDVNQQVDKNINDSVELGSSAAQAAVGHQKGSAEGEEEEIERGNGSSIPMDSEHSVVQIEREFKIGDAPEEKDGRFEDDESVSRSSCEGSSESSGGSGSKSEDDEPHHNGISQLTVDIAPEAESPKAADCLSGRSDENEFRALNEESGNAVEENSPPVDFMEISQSHGAEKHVDSHANDSLPSSSVAESVFKENEETKPRSAEDKVDALMDFMSTDAPSEATSQSIENIVTISDHTTEENDDSLKLSHAEVVKEVDNRNEHKRKSGITEPLLVPAPVQTSWTSCCGVFELFTGSGR